MCSKTLYGIPIGSGLKRIHACHVVFLITYMHFHRNMALRNVVGCFKFFNLSCIINFAYVSFPSSFVHPELLRDQGSYKSQHCNLSFHTCIPLSLMSLNLLILTTIYLQDRLLQRSNYVRWLNFQESFKFRMIFLSHISERNVSV